MGKKKGKTQDEKGAEGDEETAMNEDMDVSTTQRGMKKQPVQNEHEESENQASKKTKKGKKKDDWYAMSAHTSQYRNIPYCYAYESDCGTVLSCWYEIQLF